MSTARSRKRIADGGTAPHAGSCPSCSAGVIFHRSGGGGTVTLDIEPVSAENVHPDSATRFVLFAGTAIPDPDPRNVPDGSPFYREHRCASL